MFVYMKKIVVILSKQAGGRQFANWCRHVSVCISWGLRLKRGLLRILNQKGESSHELYAHLTLIVTLSYFLKL